MQEANHSVGTDDAMVDGIAGFPGHGVGHGSPDGLAVIGMNALEKQVVGEGDGSRFKAEDAETFVAPVEDVAFRAAGVGESISQLPMPDTTVRP